MESIVKNNMGIIEKRAIYVFDNLIKMIEDDIKAYKICTKPHVLNAYKYENEKEVLLKFNEISKKIFSEKYERIEYNFKKRLNDLILKSKKSFED